MESCQNANGFKFTIKKPLFYEIISMTETKRNKPTEGKEWDVGHRRVFHMIERVDLVYQKNCTTVTCITTFVKKVAYYSIAA